MPNAISLRRSPTADFTPVSGPKIALTPLEFAIRMVFRGRPAAQIAAGEGLGLPLPTTPCRAATAGQRAALWLGPDEWLLLAPDEAALETALAGHPHSLVDISHRQAALAVTGPKAAAALGAGCPLDLDIEAFPVGMCTRTVLAKTQIVLWRTAPETFHVEAWRGFLPYVWGFLTEASREFSG
jgi:sarcosine oxidase subunit gamma